MKVGDLVKAAYIRHDIAGIFHTGVIVKIDEVTEMFSEIDGGRFKENNTYIRVLSKGTIMTFGLSEDQVEVIK